MLRCIRTPMYQNRFWDILASRSFFWNINTRRCVSPSCSTVVSIKVCWERKSRALGAKRPYFRPIGFKIRDSSARITFEEHGSRSAFVTVHMLLAWPSRVDPSVMSVLTQKSDPTPFSKPIREIECAFSDYLPTARKLKHHSRHMALSVPVACPRLDNAWFVEIPLLISD